MKRLLIILTMVSAISSIAFSTNYYVRTDGNDSNAGTSNTSGGAWKSVAAKAGSLNPGDVLWIADGTYNESDITIQNKVGSDANRIVIRAINSKQAKISSQAVWSAIHVINCTGVTIQDIEVSFPAGSTNREYCILVEESNFVTVKNNTVNNAGCSGIQFGTSDNILVEGNYAYGNASRNEYNGSGISVGFLKAKSNSGATYAVIIRNNISQGNNCNLPFTPGGQSVPTDGNGIICDMWTLNGYSKTGLVENNLCFNNGGKGIQILQTNNVTVRNNTVWHNNYILKNYSYSGDINIDGTNNQVINNITVAEPSFNQISALKIANDNGGTVLKNNILVAPNSGRQFDCYSGTTLTSNGNSGNQTNTNDLYPKFVTPSGDGSVANFKLQSASPAINAGTNTNAATVDLDWATRPQGGTTDIGCYEFAGTTSDTQVPSIPGGLTSSSITSTSFNLSWTASTDNVGVSSYEVFRNGTSVGTVTTTSKSITGLSASTTYSMTVKAKDAAGNTSAASSALNVTTSAASGGTVLHIEAESYNAKSANTYSDGTAMNALNTGEYLQFNNVSMSGQNNFSARVSAVDAGGQIQVRLGSTTGTIIGTLTIAATGGWTTYNTQTVAITGTSGTQTIVLTIANAPYGACNLDWFELSGGTTADTQAPTTPSNLTASNITQTGCTLSWTASTDNVGVSKYHIYKNGTWIAETTPSTLSYNVTGLTANTTFTLNVQAQDAANNYSASASKSVKTLSVNLLTNPGAESGTTGWTGKNCTLTAITTQKYAGANGFSAASRTGSYAGPSQDIIAALNSNGTGTYYCETWVKLASGTANAKITVYLKYNNTDYYLSLTSVAVNATGWTKVSGTFNLNWSATLQVALYYIETDAGTTTLYVDDCWLNKGSTKSAQVANTINTVSYGYFKMFPNPVTNQNLTISFLEYGLNQTNNVLIYDLSGKQIFNKTTTESELLIDATKLKQGMYIVNVLNGNTIYNQKLVIK